MGWNLKKNHIHLHVLDVSLLKITEKVKRVDIHADEELQPVALEKS